MPAKTPAIAKSLKERLRQIGEQIRKRRKSLNISATTTSEAAELSRVTLHRIEKGEPSVTMGAYISVISALGLKLELKDSTSLKQKNSSYKLPKTIRIKNYGQLKRLAWQLDKDTELTPKDSLALYERNWRHIDFEAMDTNERSLLNALLVKFGKESLLV